MEFKLDDFVQTPPAEAFKPLQFSELVKLFSYYDIEVKSSDRMPVVKRNAARIFSR